jgi:polyisoprenoid-binding protein YceI
VRKVNDGAEVAGTITIRGVSRPTVLHAGLYRQQGTAPGDLSLLTVHLTGAVNRSEFGATGWSDMVADQVRMDIVAQIQRTD